MPTPQEMAEVYVLAKRFEKLSPSNRLRVAAAYLDVGKADIAETLVGDVVEELRASAAVKK